MKSWFSLLACAGLLSACSSGSSPRSQTPSATSSTSPAGPVYAKPGPYVAGVTTLTMGDTLADLAAGPADGFKFDDMARALAGAINGLSDREKIVLALYYHDNLTLEEIGQVLGVTESRVCQIHTKAVFHLRGVGFLRAA